MSYAQNSSPVYHVYYSCGCDALIASPGMADPMGLLADTHGDRLDVRDAFPCIIHKQRLSR